MYNKRKPKGRHIKKRKKPETSTATVQHEGATHQEVEGAQHINTTVKQQDVHYPSDTGAGSYTAGPSVPAPLSAAATPHLPPPSTSTQAEELTWSHPDLSRLHAFLRSWQDEQRNGMESITAEMKQIRQHLQHQDEQIDELRGVLEHLHNWHSSMYRTYPPPPPPPQ